MSIEGVYGISELYHLSIQRYDYLNFAFHTIISKWRAEKWLSPMLCEPTFAYPWFYYWILYSNDVFNKASLRSKLTWLTLYDWYLWLVLPILGDKIHFPGHSCVVARPDQKKGPNLASLNRHIFGSNWDIFKRKTDLEFSCWALKDQLISKLILKT